MSYPVCAQSLRPFLVLCNLAGLICEILFAKCLPCHFASNLQNLFGCEILQHTVYMCKSQNVFGYIGSSFLFSFMLTDKNNTLTRSCKYSKLMNCAMCRHANSAVHEIFQSYWIFSFLLLDILVIVLSSVFGGGSVLCIAIRTMLCLIGALIVLFREKKLKVSA